MNKLLDTAKRFLYLLSFVLFFCISFSFCPVQRRSPEQPPYRNPDLSLDERVKDLVERMTLDEKVMQMLYNAPAIERLGVPEYNWWNEALHGVARAGRATVFPQAIGLAATWDTDFMRRVATAVSDEARAKYHDALRKERHGIYEGLTFWAPNINLFRDPRWGRGMETYGEDPYLTGCLAIEFVKGMQGDDPNYLKTIATPKHFAVHSGPEPDRHTFDAVVAERDLRDTYLPQFRAAVIDGHAQSVMCAYNRFRGWPCCGSDELLQKILRGEWGFDGYVVSDCWAIMDFYTTHKVVKTAREAAAMALKAGTDLNCGVTYDSLGVAVRNGLVGEELVDRAVERLFRARFKLGMFDPPERVPYAGVPIDVVDSKEHRELAREAARKSIVLLKNDGHLLPLRKDIHSIAVIGPNANDRELLLGNYNGIPSESVTPLEGILRSVGSRTKVTFSRGCDVAEGVPAFQIVPSMALSSFSKNTFVAGLTGEYFSNNNLAGTPDLIRIDSSIDFNWWDQPAAKELSVDTFSVRWTGRLTPGVTGRHALGVNAIGSCRLYIDDTLYVESNDRHVVSTEWKYISFTQGKARRIRIEYRHLRPDAIVRLVWSQPNPRLRDEAIANARDADVVVVCLGLSPRLEGEEMRIDVPGFFGGDRVDLGLPAVQEELLRSLASAGKPVVLVLLNGSALGINWAAKNTPAIIEAWYPGQAAGEAIADVLFGNYNPSGRLPVTFYRSVDQLPPFGDYRMTGRTYRYFRGKPLYEFGYGLSYTTFQYKNLRVPGKVPAGENVEVSVDVVNSGDRAGDEVVQLYVKDISASVDVPIRSLQGFRRIALRPGQEQTLTFSLTPRQLSLIDTKGNLVLEPGLFEVSVGGRQPASSTGGVNQISETLAGKFEITGNRQFIGERR